MRYNQLLNEVDITSVNFKQWFNSSKVVDKNGNPLICYHGTPANHEIHPAGSQHFGTFIAANERIDIVLHDIDIGIHSIYSSEYQYQPHIYPVYLSIKNPIMLFDEGEWSDSAVVPQLRDKRLITHQVFHDFVTGKSDIDWIDLCKTLGFDGVSYINEYEHVGSTSWFPFDDKQVWNVFNNTHY